MKIVLSLASLALLSSPAWCGDTVITTAKHSDAVNMPGQSRPAEDKTEVMWIGKDHMRVEDGTDVTIVRMDLKKMYMLDTAAKTVTTVDLPFDMKKYLPAEMAPMLEQMFPKTPATLTPSTETQKIKDWNATKYTLTKPMPRGGQMTQVMWVTKDVAIDRTGWQDMFAAQMASNPFAGGMADEMKKLDGITVLTERTVSMMGNEMKSKDSVASIETKDAPPGHYEVPAGYTEKPFDLDEMMGAPGGHARGAGGRGPR